MSLIISLFTVTPVLGDWSAVNPNAVINCHYTYDQIGNITNITDNVSRNNSQNFSYDDVNRLMSAIGPYGSQNYSYDSIGNIQGRPEPPKDENG
ncbi:MAG: hypothetical protein V1709_11715, partial [Planctomycetota bacterium]